MIVPYIVVRSNNLPLEMLGEITGSDVIETLANDLISLRARLIELRDDTCSCLHQLAAGDDVRYRALIDVKRKIFNSAPPHGVLERYGSLLDMFPQLSDWTYTARCLVRQEQVFDIAVKREIERTRGAIKALASEDVFQCGIAFSRGQVSRAVLDYVAGGQPTGKDALNDEETLYRFLTRAVTRVSPFSTFTSVGFSRLSQSGPSRVIRNNALKSRYSYDRATFLKLYDRFVIRHKKFWTYRLTDNRVDTCSERQAFLFMDRADRYAYRTSFVKAAVPTHANVELLAAEWTSWERVETLLPSTTDRDVLLNRWIAAGMLEYQPRLSEQAPDLVAEFRVIAESVASTDASAQPVLDLLRQIETLYRGLHCADSRTLPTLTEAIDAAIRSLAEQLDQSLVKKSGLVYHDTYLPSLGAIGDHRIAPVAQEIEEFLRGYVGYNFRDDLTDAEWKRLRADIPTDRTLNVFLFNEAAQRTLTAGNTGEPSRSLRSLLSLYEEVWCRRAENEIVLARRPLPAGHNRRAFSAYGHLIGDQFVLNGVDSGYLRCLSRFFALADDASIVTQCREAYGTELEDAYEFYDTFGFNTACRPRLCGGRIRLDIGTAHATGDLPLPDLGVRWPADRQLPQFVNMQTGQPVTLRHTALFITSLYPRLLENLLRFASIGEPSYFAFRFGLFKLVADQGDGAPISFPRVRYGDVILSRRQWWIPKACLPARCKDQDPVSYFHHIDDWRRRFGLPQRVFLRRHRLDKVLSRDVSNLKKPLFLDFSAPIMSRMIMRALHAGFDYLSVEEMLPDHRDGFVSDGNFRYASEIIFEQACTPAKDGSP